MPVFNGSRFSLVDTFVDDNTTDLTRPIQITSLEIGGVTYVYVAANSSDAIQVFTMDDTGQLSPVTSFLDNGLATLDSVWSIDSVTVGGNDFVLAGGVFENGISLFSATDTTPYLTLVDNALQSDDANFNLSATYDLEIVTIGARAFAYATGYNSDGISVFEVTSGGTLNSVQHIDDGGTLELNGPIGITHFTRGSFDYIAVNGYDDRGLTVFSIASDGRLVERASIDLPDLAATWYSAAITIDGKSYIFATSESSDSVKVLEFDGTSLTEIQEISSTTQLEAARAVSVVQHGDTATLVVHAYDSSSMELFSIETNPLSSDVGTLSPVQSLRDNENGELNGTQGGETITVDGNEFYVASGYFDNALNVYAIGGGDDVLEGTGRDDEINGRGGDDFLYGFEGDDTMDGGDGVDMIFAGSGNDTVLASLGNDRSNGGSGYDTFDARIFNGEAEGVVIDLNADRFILPDGQRTFITNFERIYGTDQDDRLNGDTANNDLRGGAGDDNIKGRDGNDVLRGQNGDDKITGDDGNDRILGGWGDDYNLSGGNGNDTIDGEGNNDSLYGGNGDDLLDGGDGDDRIDAGADNDTLEGGNGMDRLIAGSGEDILIGDSENDFLFGDAGADTLEGGAGDDALTGGADADIFIFATGDGYDRIKDWEDGVDVVALYGLASDLAEVLSVAVQYSGGVRLEFAGGERLLFEGVNVSELSDDDFAFFL